MSEHFSEHERSAAGLDYDEPMRDRATSLGSRLVENPNEFFDEIEEMIPEPVLQQVRQFPLAAIALGVGVGVFLGMKKGTELLSAGSSLLTAAAAANFSQLMQSANPDE